jgi:tetratricopeptide repeat protein/NB-ARC domain-containing protein
MNERPARLETRQLKPMEVGDALYLAAHIQAMPLSVAAGRFGDPLAEEPVEPTPGNDLDEPAPETRPEPDSAGDDAGSPETVGTLYRTGSAAVAEGVSAGRVAPPWPEPDWLPQELRIARALRPLMATVDSPWESVLAEEKTAVHAAEQGLWLPEYEPAQMHPFDVLLVEDGSASMCIWQRTARELRTLLERQGAFRDVRHVRMDSDQTRLVLRGGDDGSLYRDPSQVVDPTGRRIILVLTDGIGIAWRTGVMGRLLRSWARTAPLAVAHVLPAEMWHWTGMDVYRARIRATEPRLPNARLTVLSGHGSRRLTPIPILGLEARWFRRWAEVLTGTAAGGVEISMLQVAKPADEDEGRRVVEPDVSAAQRVLNFRALATPQAFRLAGLLAAAPLTIKMMRAIQSELLPGTEPAHLAEVFVGGLLCKVPVPVGGGMAEYDFLEGLRPELLASSTRSDTSRALHLVGRLLGPKVGVGQNQLDALNDPEAAADPAITPENRHFIAVQHDALRALAGKFGPRARRLREALSTPIHPEVTTVDVVRPTPTSRRPWPAGLMPASGSRIGGSDMAATSSDQPVQADRRSGEQPAVWGGVPLRNVNFTGRLELLDKVYQRLSASTRTAVLPEALHGLGGVGKSQIAVEYVYRHATEYDLIWWIPAEEPMQIQTALVDLAKRLKLPVEPSRDTAVPAVMEALESGEPHPNWLLIFDNADRPEDVRSFFPRRFGHILVTSRNAQWSTVADAVEVDVFTRDESRQLLQRRNREMSDSDADRLAEALGDLPLAVEQAAAWRAETGMSADEYLRLFEDKRAELLETAPPPDYQVAVAAAWNVSLDRLRRENPGALDLLRVCAFFAPEPISRNLLASVQELSSFPELEETLRDPILLSRAIREINRYSLARIDHRNDTIQLHRLVQLALRNQLTDEERETVRHAAHVILASSDPNQADRVENWPRYSDLMPHVRACQAVDCENQWVRRLAINIAVFLYAWGDPNGAGEMAAELVQYWTDKLGEAHRDTLMAARWQGRALREVGRFKEARVVGERTLLLLREHLGEDHEDTLLAAHAVASDLRAKGDFKAARVLNEDAYRRAQARFGDDDPDTLAAANNYALSLRLVGDFQTARRLDEDTWRRKVGILGENHRHTLLTLDNWSVDLRECGEWVRACEVQEETVSRFRTHVGPRHPMTLAATKNLAVARRRAGDDRNAFSLAQEAFDGFRGRYGERHPDAMSAAMNLSINLRQVGDLDPAQELGMHVHRLYEQAWGAEHPFSLAAATNLAGTLRMLDALDEARQLNENALRRMRVVLGEDHPFTLVAATNLISDLAAVREFEEARQLGLDTLDRSGRALSPDHPSTLAVATNLALDLREVGQIDEADELQRDTVARFRRALGQDHPATIGAVHNYRASCDIDAMQI